MSREVRIKITDVLEDGKDMVLSYYDPENPKVLEDQSRKFLTQIENDFSVAKEFPGYIVVSIFPFVDFTDKGKKVFARSVDEGRLLTIDATRQAVRVRWSIAPVLRDFIQKDEQLIIFCLTACWMLHEEIKSGANKTKSNGKDNEEKKSNEEEDNEE